MQKRAVEFKRKKIICFTHPRCLQNFGECVENEKDVRPTGRKETSPVCTRIVHGRRHRDTRTNIGVEKNRLVNVFSSLTFEGASDAQTPEKDLYQSRRHHRHAAAGFWKLVSNVLLGKYAIGKFGKNNDTIHCIAVIVAGIFFLI